MSSEETATAEKPKKVRGRPFQKGASGNPKGRRPLPPEVKELFVVNDQRAAQRIVDTLDSPDEKLAFQAATYIYERNHGKTPQPIVGAEGESGSLPIIINLSPRPKEGA